MGVTEAFEARGDAPIESSIPVDAVPLESILCTDELHRRPSRPPRYEEENSALVKLRSALADSPSTILQALAETILHITQCDSAGLSLLTRDGQTPDPCGESFYWPAIAGMWNPHVGGGTPRNFGPCGDVLDRNCTLLFNHFERRYPYLQPVVPAAEECLLVPFYVAGKAVGTIWAIMHSDRRKFDAEDDRVMGSLGKFASSAYQTLAFIDELRFQIGERENAEAALHKLADGLEMQVRVRTQELERSTDELLATNKELEKEITERQRAEQALIGAQSHLTDLADEQAALREVATLVARGAEPRAVFDAVCEATGQLIGAASVNLAQFAPDETNLTRAGWSQRGTHVPPGTRLPLEGDSINAFIKRTQAPGRVESYKGLPGPLAARLRELGIRSEVGAPVIVDGQVWGTLIAGTDQPEPLPRGAELRLARFTELVATAIANAEARQELQQLADEQAALREVATLVAHGADPRAVFDAVCEATGRLIGAAIVNLAHFPPDGSNVTLAGWSQHGAHIPPATRLPLDGDSVGVRVKRTRAASRVDNYDNVPGQLAARARELGIRSGVGAPVIVDGGIWGALIAGTDSPEPLPPGAELRVASFAEMIGTAVSNAMARSELIESRARMITAFDAARRRVTRDLHDGAQQQFVTAIINLQLALQKWPSAPQQAKELLDLALHDANSGMQELREIAAGIHPAILTHRGLGAALEALAARVPIPIELEVTDQRLPEAIEASIYFFCSEALTNVVKHARASSAWLRVAPRDDRCTVEVRDDGIGGADSRPGTSGLTGLRDRIGALKGVMEVSSPVAGGTVLRAWIPLPPESATSALEFNA